MSEPGGADREPGGRESGGGESGGGESGGGVVGAAFIVFAVLAVVFAVVVIVAVLTLTGDGDQASGTAPARTAPQRDLPATWEVKDGDTYIEISNETGLTIDELETLNPRTDPSALVPGERIKLRELTAAEREKKLGPKIYKVKPGDSFGSISVETDRTIARLRELNPKLSPEKLQPGDEVRLR